jgi:hypothetical protein
MSAKQWVPIVWLLPLPCAAFAQSVAFEGVTLIDMASKAPRD